MPYSPETKQAALAMCAESGSYRTSKQTGIPQSTLANWMKKAGVSTNNAEKTAAATKAKEVNIAARRAELKELLLDKALDLAHRIDEPHIDFKSAGREGLVQVTYPKPTAKDCYSYSYAIGILIDKFRLESGEVTSRDEHRNVNRTELDEEIDRLLADMADRKEAGPEGCPADEAGQKSMDTAQSQS